jgi:hypothetical protein
MIITLQSYARRNDFNGIRGIWGANFPKSIGGDKRGDFEIERKIRISRHNECNMRVQYESAI